ncbi:L-type lectin-domain containing receptor kinase SIT2-like [Triticum dicoccoides]|uniref:L-type lectin-domain containing receptor kinase SIT2-like n=1 Tax=Triticum dicoccoides TaxID=85692 RepID=UPI000E7CA97A|nr:L-type lectin-domain containing receptor kinase SIT2-like [Triticum dicoccoides]
MVRPNMKPIVQFFLKLLLIVLSAPQFIAGDDNQRFVYSGFADTSLALDGIASVTPSGLLELTNGTAMSMGHAFYPPPLRLRDSPNGMVQSFSTSFVFGIISIYDLSSHGLTMLVAPSKDFSKATPVQYLGLVNGSNNGNTTNHIFAVELDTWQNTEFGDINNNHIGIDINGLSSVQSHPAGFFHDHNGMFKDLTLSSQEAMQVWVDYDREKIQIDVTMAPLDMATKPKRPTVSTRYNLSTVLKDVAYIGFSSSTGKIKTRHYVLGWSFAMNGPAPVINVTMLPKLPRHHPKGNRSWVLEIVLPVATAAVLLSLGTIAFLFVQRHLRYAQLRDSWEMEFGPHRFSYKDLYHATGGFEDRNLLGVGGFGRVYKGVLPRSRLKIAVKRVSHDSKQGMKEFIAEIVSIGRLQNRNLVPLLGYCPRKGELLLVYEYMPNGSLDKYLHGKGDNTVLSWAQRFHIVKGIASGLLYLHEEWEKVVVHRDIKASNVLLDDKMNGRLGDFGLARLYDHGIDPQTTHVVGTIGYLAPELAHSGNATPPTDVFAFGMFILEVTCGQRPVNYQNAQGNQLMLVDWVIDNVQKGSFDDTVDARLKGRYDVDEAYLALKIGLLCSHPFINARPSMRQVMQYLDGEIEPPELRSESLALMQNDGFEPYTISYPLSTTSIGTVSHVSGGR